MVRLFDKNGVLIQKGNLIKCSSNRTISLYEEWKTWATTDGFYQPCGKLPDGAICLVLKTHYIKYSDYESFVFYVLTGDKKVFFKYDKFFICEVIDDGRK